MIAKLSGEVIKVLEESVIVEVDSLAYEVFAPERLLQSLSPDQSVKLWTTLVLGDSDIKLYGFAKYTERQMFNLLTSISGVGPKMALGVLSHAAPTEIKQAIRESNTSLFKSVSGIGTKNANRIVVELQNKVGDADADAAQKVQISSQEADQIYSALKNLGYKKSELSEALKQIDHHLSTEEKIKEVLKIMGGGSKA